MAGTLVEANGAFIPNLGFGTWQLKGDACRDAVATALAAGYRHIDTAAAYGNEEAVGAGLRASSIPREEIFVTTKIWPTDFHPDDLKRAADERLRLLGLEQVDLLLLHWPNPHIPLADTLGALCEVKRAGKARSIGVSNFTVDLIRKAVDLAEESLAANQVEYHPFLSQEPVLDELRRQGMALTAYSPVAKGKVNDDPLLKRIADAHGKTPVQVALRWLLQQRDVVAIPRSSSAAHIKTNADIFDFALSDEEMRDIHGLARPGGRMVAVEGFAPAWDTA